jgi:hypothetical protein
MLKDWLLNCAQGREGFVSDSINTVGSVEILERLSVVFEEFFHSTFFDKATV